MSNHVLFEIGIEELPARFIDYGEKQLREKTEKWLKEQRISFESITSYSTPRRLAVAISNIATNQTTIMEEVRGPQVNIAKDERGNWTKAAIGFTKGQGKQPEDIYIKEIKGTPYIFVEKRLEGKRTIDILPSFREVLTDLSFPQTMRWGKDTFRFARPIRWIVAIMNDQIVPFEVANVKTNNISFGHRFLGGKCVMKDPQQYETILEKNYVIVDPKKREQMILEQMKQVEEKTGFHILVTKSLLNEVRNLVEYPTVFYGSFSNEYLKLPQETLITSMQEHQRYFPVMTEEKNQLLPYFVSVRNGDEQAINNVIRGNEKVLRARLADAAFFYEEDKKYSIEFFVNKLKTVVFQEKIGTIYEKQNKIKHLTKKISEAIELEQKKVHLALRAAEICKFDLVTSMVNEFTELQGVMGEKYAIHFGEDIEVATAIKEHYLPVQANGDFPETIVGSVVSVADKLDTVVGCISVDLIPSGSQDPYGLRRQTIGILRILLQQKWKISVESLLTMAKELYDLKGNDEQLHHFFMNRAMFIFSELGLDHDIMKAILHEKIGVISYTLDKAKLLSEKRNDLSFKYSQEAFVRIINIGKEHHHSHIEPSLFQTETEKALYEQYVQVKETFFEYDSKFHATNALIELEKLAKPIHLFFEHNMVMDKNEKVKINRLALVHCISSLIQKYADVSLIEWKK